jgi:hypothetical protein
MWGSVEPVGWHVGVVGLPSKTMTGQILGWRCMIEIPVSYMFISADLPREVANATCGFARYTSSWRGISKSRTKDFHLPIYPFPTFGG